MHQVGKELSDSPRSFPVEIMTTPRSRTSDVGPGNGDSTGIGMGTGVGDGNGGTHECMFHSGSNHMLNERVLVTPSTSPLTRMRACVEHPCHPP